MPSLKYLMREQERKGEGEGETEREKRELLINEGNCQVPFFFVGQRVADVPVCWKTRECLLKMYPFFELCSMCALMCVRVCVCMYSVPMYVCYLCTHIHSTLCVCCVYVC